MPTDQPPTREEVMAARKASAPHSPTCGLVPDPECLGCRALDACDALESRASAHIAATQAALVTVSYTHLTLPTNREV